MTQHPQAIDLNKALEVLKSGRVILYPTDTIWGLGCDATNEQAVRRIFEIKKRELGKSMVLLVHNDNQLAGYIREVPEVAYELIEASDKPLTIVYSDAKNLPSVVIAPDGSVGIRVVRHAFCEKLLQRFRKPIVSTSANISGQPAPTCFSDIDEKIRSAVDYIVQYDQDDYQTRPPSTVMRIDGSGKFEFLRK